jgi:predicted RecA/RadA family phage recombinase
LGEKIMTKKMVQPGFVLPITLGATTAVGALVAIGDIYVVALEAGGNGDVVQGAFEGVFDLPKKDAVTILQGEQLYLDTGELTNVANANPVGVAAAGGASAATSVLCAINRVAAKAILADAAAYADSL